MERLHILHRSGYIGNEPPVRINCANCTKDCAKRKGVKSMNNDNGGERPLGLPSMGEVIAPYAEPGKHIDREDYRRFLMDKGVDEVAADILSASTQPVSLEAQIEAAKQVRSEGTTLRANATIADKARYLIEAEYGTHKTEEMFRSYSSESLANLAYEIAKRLTAGTERLELPTMNIRRRDEGKDDGILRLPAMQFERGIGK